MAKAATIELRAIRSDPHAVWVVVSGDRLHRLTRVVAAELGVYSGERWTAALARRVDTHARSEALRRAALRLLGQRDHSTASLRDRLARLGATARDIQSLLSDLTRAGWLDDARSLASRTASLQDRGWSRARVAATLEAEGFDAAAIERSLCATPTGDCDLLRQSIRTSRRAAPATMARRLIAAGFDPDEVWSALEEFGMARDGVEA